MRFPSPALLCAPFVLGCPGPNDSASGPAPADFSFLVVGDLRLTGDDDSAARLGALVQAVGDGTWGDPAFVLFTGDLVHAATDSSGGDNWARLDDTLSTLPIPWYPVLGEHDHRATPQDDLERTLEQADLDAAEASFTDVTGLNPYYSFMFQDWHFLALDSMRGAPEGRFFDEGQRSWFDVEFGRQQPLIAYWHHSVQDDDAQSWCTDGDLVSDETEPELMARLVEKNRRSKAIFTGHGACFTSGVLNGATQLFLLPAFEAADDLLVVTVEGDNIASMVLGNEY